MAEGGRARRPTVSPSPARRRRRRRRRRRGLSGGWREERGTVPRLVVAGGRPGGGIRRRLPLWTVVDGRKKKGASRGR